MVYTAVDYSHMYTILTNIVHSLLVIPTNLCDFMYKRIIIMLEMTNIFIACII